MTTYKDSLDELDKKIHKLYINYCFSYSIEQHEQVKKELLSLKEEYKILQGKLLYEKILLKGKKK